MQSTQPNHGEHRPEEWPFTLRGIAQSIGVDGAMSLVEHLGGLEYYIPVQATEDHELARVLGMSLFQRLARSHGGQRIAIPRDPYASAAKGQIMTLAEQGIDARTIARQVGVTQRYVRRVLELCPSAPKPADPRQLKLPY